MHTRRACKTGFLKQIPKCSSNIKKEGYCSLKDTSVDTTSYKINILSLLVIKKKLQECTKTFYYIHALR